MGTHANWWHTRTPQTEHNLPNRTLRHYPLNEKLTYAREIVNTHVKHIPMKSISNSVSCIIIMIVTYIFTKHKIIHFPIIVLYLRYYLLLYKSRGNSFFGSINSYYQNVRHDMLSRWWYYDWRRGVASRPPAWKFEFQTKILKVTSSFFIRLK